MKDFLGEPADMGKKPLDVRTLSPLVLAYVGDAVFELIVRTRLVRAGNRPVNDLHRSAAGIVSAKAQSAFVKTLLPLLTEEEFAVYQRGKNAKPHTTAKNASNADYHRATGFEALIGYLYLTDRLERILELLGPEGAAEEN